jgi:hypothetical protein
MIIAQVLIILPLLEGVTVSDGGTERERCAGASDAERARCEGAIDRNLLQMTGTKVNEATELTKENTQEGFWLIEC